MSLGSNLEKYGRDGEETKMAIKYGACAWYAG